ncbi:SDR family oxidoreductase [Nocardioides solisilvae]|uniref:SDR family oxidoreductase n=1 Tax=Nocardioides solisilvae TaxID=1542435 RepID=UPI000D74C159|nr:SDR family oxidoreductase [Nocardioides solisilvae]
MTAPRTHLVTGAGSGIGRALARRLAARGDRLVLLARTHSRADEIQADLPGHACHVVDLAQPDAVVTAGTLLAETERFDSVVHCAGVVHLGPVATLNHDAWQEQIQVNLTAPARLTRAVLPALRAARGTLVLVNSTAIMSANPGWSAYAASKAGLRAFADAVRAEEAEHGVRVTSVYPSRTATPMQARVHRQEGRAYDEGVFVSPESVAETICHVIDLPADSTIPDLTVRTAPRPSA